MVLDPPRRAEGLDEGSGMLGEGAAEQHVEFWGAACEPKRLFFWGPWVGVIGSGRSAVLPGREFTPAPRGGIKGIILLFVITGGGKKKPPLLGTLPNQSTD